MVSVARIVTNDGREYFLSACFPALIKSEYLHILFTHEPYLVPQVEPDLSHPWTHHCCLDC